MSGTKEKILSVSLELFNEEGLANVSQRRVTGQMKISPGNLTYHFKKKEDISEALYFQFIQSVQSEVSDFLHGDISIKSFHSMMVKWFELVYEYRFIFIDLSQLIRGNKKIAENYQIFLEIRESVFIKIVDKLIGQKMMVKSKFENEYNLLYKRMHLMSDYFLAHHSSFEQQLTEQLKVDHVKLLFSAMYPYLTAKGVKELNKYIEF